MTLLCDKAKVVKSYTDVMRFSAENLLGNQEETVFVGAPFIGEKSSEKVVLGAHVAPRDNPEDYDQVIMQGWTTPLRAYQAIVICRDLFRMRINDDGTSMTFDELIIALDSDDCGARYDFVGDLADDFRYSRDELIHAVEMCRNLTMPLEELLAFGEG